MSGLVGDNLARASGVIASPGGGAILQVKSVQLNSTISVGSSATPVAITAFNIVFTPTADTSKWCLQLSLNCSTNGSGTGGYFYDSTGAAKIEPYAAASGSKQRLSWGPTYTVSHCSVNQNFTAWFTPGDTTTRTIQVWAAADTSKSLYVNRTYDDGAYTTINYARSASTFTITEYDGSLVTVA